LADDVPLPAEAPPRAERPAAPDRAVLPAPERDLRALPAHVPARPGAGGADPDRARPVHGLGLRPAQARARAARRPLEPAPERAGARARRLRLHPARPRPDRVLGA